MCKSYILIFDFTHLSLNFTPSTVKFHICVREKKCQFDTNTLPYEPNI